MFRKQGIPLRKSDEKIEMYNHVPILTYVMHFGSQKLSCFLEILLKFFKGGRALRGYFGPPMRSKNKSCSSQVSSYLFIRTIIKVLSSGIDSTFTVAMVTKMAVKLG